MTDFLLPISARDPKALEAYAGIYADFLERPNGPPLKDICYTASARRAHHSFRLAAVGSDRAQLAQALRAFAGAGAELVKGRRQEGKPRRVVFVFPGQGSQWVGMARELDVMDSHFSECLKECFESLKPFLDWSPQEVFLANENTERLQRIDIVQPLLFAIQVALASWWRARGIEPDVVIGHSMGEVAAAQVAGALTLVDAARVICVRSKLLRTISGKGGMAMVECSLAQAREVLRDYPKLAIAVNNSPRSCVVSGDSAELEQLVQSLEKTGVFCRRVKVDVASHSPQVHVLRDPLLRELAEVRPRIGEIPIQSPVTGQLSDGSDYDAAYWVRNLREPVLFADAVMAQLADAQPYFVEISPHPILVPAINDCLNSSPESALAVASLRREHPETESMLQGLAHLYANGLDPDWQVVCGDQRLTRLPAYPWSRKPFKIMGQTPSAVKRRRLVHGKPCHPMLSAYISPASQPGLHCWESHLSANTEPWLKDHVVQGQVLFPGAGYLDLVWSALKEKEPDREWVLEDVVFLRPLVLSEQSVPFQLSLTDQGNHWDFVFTTFTDDGTWVTHCKGQALPETEPLRLSPSPTDLSQTLTGVEHYQKAAERGLEYGPAFRGVSKVRYGVGYVQGQIVASPKLKTERFAFHPALLDACLQLVGHTLGDEVATYLPAEVTKVRMAASPSALMQVEAKLHGNRKTADLRVLDDSGRLILELAGLKIRQLPTHKPKDLEAVNDHRIVWEAAPLSSNPWAKRFLLIGGADSRGPQLAKTLRQLGAEVTWRTNVAGSFADFDAIIELRLLDLPGEPGDESWMGGMQPALEVSQALLNAGLRDTPALWFVTAGAIAVSPDERLVAPFRAPIWGFAASICHEHPEWRCAVIDISDDAIDRLAHECLAVPAHGAAFEERVALRGKQRFVARLISGDSQTSQNYRTPAGERAFTLTSQRQGLNGLYLKECQRHQPEKGEVEILVEAAGLNFMDVMSAMGIYPGAEEGAEPNFGGECAGRITRVGEGCQYKPGDWVMAVAPQSLSRYVVTPETFVFPKPNHLSAEEAAGLPLVFMTATEALNDLEAGETVLIHSASGGVGLAAVTIARERGARIFATAGTEEKRAFLRDLGLAHVFDSRGDQWPQEIVRATHGVGVDLVLNSLSGKGIGRGLAVLAPYGRFLDIGKKDIYQNGALNLAPFKKCLSYRAIDLLGMCERAPQRFRKLMATSLERFKASDPRYFPIQVFPVDRVSEAFHLMARARHVGKLVISNAEADQAPIVRSGGMPVHENGTYLITGGFGALGMAAARMLIKRGAGCLALAGRSAPDPATLASLQISGVKILALRGDVSCKHDVTGWFTRIAAEGFPLRGVIHAAGVLRDATLSRQTPAHFAQVLAPKLGGAWLLHQHSLSHDLDFFVLYASAASVLGSPGQSNYAAANAFLDALAHYRRGLGLPATSINWGAFSGAGLAAREDRADRLVGRGMQSMVPEDSGLHLFRLLDKDVDQTGVFPLDLRQWREFYPKDARNPFFAQQAVVEESKGATFADTLEAIPADRRAEMVEARLVAQLSAVLRCDPECIDPYAPLASAGFDSLMALELRNRLEKDLGLTLPTALIWQFPSVHLMALDLTKRLVPEEAPPEVDESSDDGLEALSEADLTNVLAQELSGGISA